MSLSRDLISQFVKITKDKEPKSKETIVYGVVSNVETKYDENGAEYKQLYVKIDGTNEESDPIPVLQTAVDAVYGDRVIVMIKNHSAIITGNMGAPATTVKTTEGIASKANSAYNLATQANTNANNAMNQVTELGVVIAKKVDTEEFTAEIAKIDNLETEIAKINNLETDTILTQTIKANSANIEGKLDAEEASLTYATIGELDATNVRIDKLEVGEGNFEQIEANTADIEKLETEVGDINTLLFGSATGETLHTNFANAVIALLGDAWIKDAMVESLSAGKILSGDILTNKVRVMSEDGGLIIADKLIQIKEGNTVRVQIGKDASGNYSIIFCDESGNTMFSKNGITENAIKDNELEVYYNGDRALTEFKIKCYQQVGKKCNYIGMYTPDFLIIKRKDCKIHKALIVETKGEIYANDPTFKQKRNFMESAFIKQNNDKFGYNRFDYLYLEDTLEEKDRIVLTLETIKKFFTEE